MDYPLEQLDPERFQKVCQALLLEEFPHAHFLPLGQPDGGRDGFSPLPGRRSGRKARVVFQMKFLRDPSTLPSLRARRKWVLDAVQEELPNIEALASEGADHYRFITNVRGSGSRRKGSIDQLDSALADLPIPADAWWRDDLITRLDRAWDIKWHYPELLTGQDLLRVLLSHTKDPDSERRDATLRAFLEQERYSDDKVKFKQVGLENSLLDLFVDLPLNPTRLDAKSSQRIARALAALEVDYESGSDGNDQTYFGHYVDHENHIRWREPSPGPAAGFLLHDSCSALAPRLVIEGAPGQGKSTVSQYVCQVHRCRLLNAEDLQRIPPQHQSGAVKFPLRVDLRDLASWLHGRNPFGTEDDDSGLTTKRTLETFLATQIEISSGGAAFSVSDLHTLARESSLFLALDGLDEVADIQERERVVAEATAAIGRLEKICLSLQVLITSRPAAFENSPGFSPDRFVYLDLAALTESALSAYSEKWIAARNLDPKSARDVRRVIGEKLEAPHMKDLARNPMQLAILLSLVHQRGPSLPDKRTALYDSYVDLFFDREAEKTPHVAEHRELLMEIHQYLGWTLHSEAETGNTQGSISDARLRALLRGYLKHEEKDEALVDDLFAALVERVVAIVSRVQGTYEFEVQPLREYFAARFLYDTAHHSSPGNEKAGDKTDRFDALARNFYWLNVTRFFAGCFSKGELLSLVERLQALAEEDGFRQTDHPRKLSSMLLADWVFAQHPRSMKAVVDIVLRDVATRADSERANDVVMLPPGSGKAEVAERCWELWKQNLPNDRSLVVAQTLSANSDASAIDQRWKKELKAKRGKGRTRWLERGLWTGSLARLSTESVQSVVKDDSIGLRDIPRLTALLRSGHARPYETDPSLTDFAVQGILGHRVGFYRPDRPARGLLEAINQISQNLRRPVEMRRGRLLNVERVIAPTGGFPDHLQPLLSLVRITNKQSQFSPKAWYSSLDPWDQVVEELRRHCGETLTSIELAACASGIRAADERGSLGEGFFDQAHSLVHRARYARLRAGNGDWWRHQLQEAETDLDRVFLATLFFSWAGRRALRAEVGLFDKWMRESSVDTRSSVNRMVSSALSAYGSASSNAQRLSLKELEAVDLHPTTFLVLSHRMGTPYPSEELVGLLFERVFADASELDSITHFYAAQGALALAVRNPRRWPEALQTIKAAYTAEVPVGRHLRYESQREEIPVALARGVVEDWKSYPLAIVNLAEESCRRDVGKRMQTLKSIARKQSWEWL